MKNARQLQKHLTSKAEDDSAFRTRLMENPKKTIEQEFGITLAKEHDIEVHEETPTTAHLVLPPKSRVSKADRKAATTGGSSMKYLKKTLSDPAPPPRPAVGEPAAGLTGNKARTSETLAGAGRAAIQRGLGFLETTIKEDGMWPSVRYVLSNPDGVRHWERSPFLSALGALALKRCRAVQAKALRVRTRAHLYSSIEYPGVWRYWRHVPPDLDSTAICSLAAGPHPWFLLGRNVERILEYRNEDGLFMTWMRAEGEPDVNPNLRYDADLVVNANIIAYLGDHEDTREAQHWVETSLEKDSPDRLSTWYPDSMALYYATARASFYSRPAFTQLRPTLAERIMDCRDSSGDFDNILLNAQAVSALNMLERLESEEARRTLERLVDSQRGDGSWPEYLAWDIPGVGFASEALTTAFCIEALECCIPPDMPDR